MKIVLVEGCVCDSLTVDGVEEVNLTEEERRSILVELGNKLPTNSLNNLLQDILYNIGSYRSLGRCEQCGDTIDEYSLEI